MSDGWREVVLGSVADVGRTRVDPRLLGDQELIHYSIPALDETGQPTRESAAGIASHKFLVESDAVLVSLLNPRIPRVWRARGATNAVCSTEFAVLTPTGEPSISVDYLHLICRSNAFWEELQKRAVGTTGSRQRAKVEGLLGIAVSVPPASIQRRIVDLMAHLDNHLANMRAERDAMSATRSRSLNLALTGRLDGLERNDAWVQTTLGDIAAFTNGYPFKPVQLSGSTTAVIRIKQLLDPLAPVDYTDDPVPERNLIDSGDLIFSWSGTLASRVWNRGPAALNQHLFKVSAKAGCDLGWLHFALDGAVGDLMLKTHGTTMKHVTKKVLEGHKILVPPMPLQRQIADLLTSFGEADAALERETQRLQGLRFGLLDALLSGSASIRHEYDRYLGSVA
jgi:restriction endonuclease S subunit